MLYLGKYEVLVVSIAENGTYWRVEVGIRRLWPLYLFDHKPWEKIPRRRFPVRTFVGRGLAWCEVAGQKLLGAGKHTPILNAIISDIISRHMQNI